MEQAQEVPEALQVTGLLLGVEHVIQQYGRHFALIIALLSIVALAVIR